MSLFLELCFVLDCIISDFIYFRRKSHTCASLFHIHTETKPLLSSLLTVNLLIIKM